MPPAGLKELGSGAVHGSMVIAYRTVDIILPGIR